MNHNPRQFTVIKYSFSNLPDNEEVKGCVEKRRHYFENGETL